jgi:hypothetical protein
MSSPEEQVADAFNRYFANFDIRVEPDDVVVGSHRTIHGEGWLIRHRVDPDDAGFPSLEFYATHRMTDDRHIRIWADGALEGLDAIQPGYGYNPKAPGSKEAAEQEYRRHSQEIARQLRERGLYPEGDINTYLRTTGAGDQSDIDESNGPRDGGGIQR